MGGKTFTSDMAWDVLQHCTPETIQEMDELLKLLDLESLATLARGRSRRPSMPVFVGSALAFSGGGGPTSWTRMKTKHRELPSLGTKTHEAGNESD